MNDLAHNRHWLSRPPAPMHHKSISMCIFPLRISFHVCVIFAENDGQLGHETRFRMKVLGHSTVAEFKALIRSVWESRVRAVYDIQASSEDVLEFCSLEADNTPIVEVLERVMYCITIISVAD